MSNPTNPILPMPQALTEKEREAAAQRAFIVDIINTIGKYVLLAIPIYLTAYMTWVHGDKQVTVEKKIDAGEERRVEVEGKLDTALAKTEEHKAAVANEVQKGVDALKEKVQETRDVLEAKIERSMPPNIPPGLQPIPKPDL